MTDDELDDAALELCLQQVLDGADGPSRVQQVRDFLDGYHAEGPRPRREVAEFCSYVRQCQTLNLAPWESAPCQRADGVIHREGDSFGLGDEPAARLARKMRDAGVSPYHPDPIAALAGNNSRS
jgi:hypothetical protein